MKSPRAKAGAAVGFSATLAALLERLVASAEGVTVTATERAAWPDTDVGVLMRAGLLQEASAANWLQCPGCEQACAMEVEVVPRAGRPPAVFIVCDKSEKGMGMVPLGLDDLAQWRSTRGAVAAALARMLGGPGAVPADVTGAGVRVGVVQGRDGVRPALLVWDARGAHLRLAGHELELALVLGMGAAGLTLDMRQLVQCVNAPAGREPSEDPERRRLRYRALLDEERRVSVRGCLKRAAARAGVEVETFKKVAYRKPKPRSAMQHAVRALSIPPNKD